MVFLKKKKKEVVVANAETPAEDLTRKEGETQHEYNQRVPAGLQPVLPAPTKSYLGKDL